MLTAALLDLDWAARRVLGRGLRRDALVADGADPDVPATFTTSVIRLPPGLASRLEAVAADVASIQPRQYVCPAGSIHVTLCGPLDDDVVTTDDALVDLRDVASRLRGGRLRVVRLGLGDTSVFAALEPVGMDFSGARRELARRWAVPGRPGLAGPIASRLLWANLIRFVEPPSPALVTALARRRRASHSGFEVDAVELVRTNRAMGPDRTTVLGRVEVTTPA